MSVQVKQLKAYLAAPALLRVAAVLSLLLCLFSAVLAISSGAENGADPAEAVEFFPGDDSLRGEYVWVDVVGVSEWVYDVGEGKDVYYAIVDEYGYGYIAKMTQAQFNGLYAQHQWFMSDEEPVTDAEAPLSTDENAEEFFPGESALENTTVWVEAVGVTDWIYDDGAGRIYYAVVDEYGYGYIVAMTDSQFAQLGELNEWMNTEEDVPSPAPVYMTGISTPIAEDVADGFCQVFGYESAQQVLDVFGTYYMDMTSNVAEGSAAPAMPAAVRSCGISKLLPNDVADAFAEVWGYEDGDEVRDVFGTHYMDMTAKPGDNVVSVFVFVAAMSAAAALVLFIAAGRRNGTMKKCIKRLEQLGLLEDAAMQLNNADNEILGGDYVRLGANYLYCRRTGAVVAYSDIVWAYTHVTRTYFVVTSQTLIGYTAAYKNLPLCDAASARKGGGKDMLMRVMQVIYEKNPAVLLGYNGQNAKAYRERMKGGNA
ncbi:MAG: hypothetical protein IJC61_03475 [Oscillospiraceae bacterium]|nr:hypothetical protein [Oscillospiraceae bacterium]